MFSFKRSILRGVYSSDSLENSIVKVFERESRPADGGDPVDGPDPIVPERRTFEASVAWVAALSSLVVRGLEPALPGVWTGLDAFINATKVTGAFLSQLYAVGAAWLIGRTVLRVAVSDRSAGVRSMSIGIAGLALLTLAIGSGALSLLVAAALGVGVSPKLPLESVLVLAAMGALYAALAARERMAEPRLRGPALVVFGSAVVAALRTMAALAASRAGVEPAAAFTSAVGAVATAAALASFAVVVVALAWFALAEGRASAGQAPRPGARQRRIATVILIFGMAVGYAALTTHGVRGDSPRIPLFAARLAEALAPVPSGYGPSWVRAFAEALRYLATAAVLCRARLDAPSRAAVALALLGADLASTPLGAVSLVLGAVMLMGERAPTDRASAPSARPHAPAS